MSGKKNDLYFKGEKINSRGVFFTHVSQRISLSMSARKLGLNVGVDWEEGGGQLQFYFIERRNIYIKSWAYYFIQFQQG